MHVSANPLHVFYEICQTFSRSVKSVTFSPCLTTLPHCAHLFVLSAQLLFALFDGTSLCLHSEEQTESLVCQHALLTLRLANALRFSTKKTCINSTCSQTGHPDLLLIVLGLCVSGTFFVVIITILLQSADAKKLLKTQYALTTINNIVSQAIVQTTSC